MTRRTRQVAGVALVAATAAWVLRGARSTNDAPWHDDVDYGGDHVDNDGSEDDPDHRPPNISHGYVPSEVVVTSGRMGAA